MAKKLTIFIPAYKQPDLVRRCLSFLEQQSCKDFLVIIKDDVSEIDYQKIAEEFQDLEILCLCNQNNLGAIKNMISCITNTPTTQFVMCLHDDDFIHPKYIEYSLDILENNEEISFVGSPSVFFNPTEKPKITDYLNKDYQKYGTRDFAYFILNSGDFAFGSIIYRSNLIKSEFINLELYDVFFDRPFLLKILINSQRKAAIFINKFYFYQNHQYPDNRWKTLKVENVINLYALYKNLVKEKDKKLTSKYIYDFVNLDNKKLVDFKKFIILGNKNKLFSGRGISWKFSVASIFILVFGKKAYSKIFDFIKNK